jgi:hypothetical protein
MLDRTPLAMLHLPVLSLNQVQIQFNGISIACAINSCREKGRICCESNRFPLMAILVEKSKLNKTMFNQDSQQDSQLL